ncbi:Transgelin [Entophlyctis luteolus]|nr:Transgelin [Entophlyctis luteolus]
MSNRAGSALNAEDVDDAPKLFGLDKELAEKAAAKYDPAREAQAREYIEQVTGQSFASENFHESLKDGVLLCSLINRINGQHDQIKIQTSKMPFKQMENIGAFLNRIEKLGVPAHERFMTVDLFEGKNMNQVINCIFSISRHAATKGFSGPILGPKLAEKNERQFTEEQLREAKFMPTKLMSMNTNVASGTSFGGRREIGGKYMEKIDSSEGNDAFEAQRPSVESDRKVPDQSSRAMKQHPVPTRETQKLDRDTVSQFASRVSPDASPKLSAEPMTPESKPTLQYQGESRLQQLYTPPPPAAEQMQIPAASRIAPREKSPPPTEKLSSSPVSPPLSPGSLSITQFRSYAEYKAAKAALEASKSSVIPVPSVASPTGNRTPRTVLSSRNSSVDHTADAYKPEVIAPVAVANPSVAPTRTAHLSSTRAHTSPGPGVSHTTPSQTTPPPSSVGLVRPPRTTSAGRTIIVREYTPRVYNDSDEEVTVFED